MKKSQTLTDLEQVKALADPLRIKIIEAFCSGTPLTTKQVAERIGEKVTKLYHHVDLLERLGFVELVETRQNRGTVEKYFQATAERFVVDKSLFDVMPESDEALADLLAVARSAFEGTMQGIEEGLENGLIDFKRGDDVALACIHLQGSRKRIKALQKRIAKLIADVQLDKEDEDKEVQYGFTLAFYPMKMMTTAGDNTGANDDERNPE